MRKFIIVIIMCLCLFGCKNKDEKNPVIDGVKITSEAISVAKEYNIDLEQVKLDLSIIDADDNALLFFMKNEITEETRKEGFVSIWELLKTITDDGKVWNYYNLDQEWMPNMIDEKDTNVFLMATIDDKDYRIIISQNNHVPYKSDSQEYSMYKALFTIYEESQE